MDDSLTRREAARPPRRASAAAAAEAAAADLGANVSLQDGEMVEVMEVQPPREAHPGPDRPAAIGGSAERRNSGPPLVHQRHMPMEPNKFHIPRKTKEKKDLLHHVSNKSREFEDMMNVLTSNYMDTNSSGCFSYCQPRLVYNDLLEKEFVEKRREMKADGRTDKELEESYGFLLADATNVPLLCEKGLCVGQSWITVLGHPSKGVYLSRYSDLLQVNPFTPGASGEIIIFKVMKGKVKSIYENMKNLLDPTPRFDSHIPKNASKVTSLTSYRAFELTQQYYYEYLFDELRQRPRQVCPYAVISFQFKGKDSPLPSMPLAPIRLNSQTAETSKERAQFTVWCGDLVKGDRLLYQISLRSFSPPFLPHKLPEKLEIGWLMRLEHVTKLLLPGLFSYNLYNHNQEVVKDGRCCSLLEVVDRCRSTTSVTRLLHELETKRVVLVTPLTDRGFLFLLSSVQMATPSERGENWRRCLQALFVFPDTRDVSISTSRRTSSPHVVSESSQSVQVMPNLNRFIPALHHALVKARANPPAELSAGVERQAREYLSGLSDGKVRQYPMGEYDSKLDDPGKPSSVPKHHRVNLDGYLQSYLYNPALYLLSVARVRQVVEATCGADEQQEAKLRKSRGEGHTETTGNARDRQSNSQKMQQLIDLIMTCKRNAENEVQREEGGEGEPKALGRKRRLEKETAERTLKFLKASQEPGRVSRTPVEGSHAPASPGSLASVIGSLGLRDVDLREDGSELAAKLLSLLTGLNQAASEAVGHRPHGVQEEDHKESSPFDKLATKLGLPPNCDIDLRKQDELEEQTAGSVSSLEGFSPSSHSGEMNHHRGGGGGAGLWKRAGGFGDEEEDGEIPWVLIPITGLCSERYAPRDRNLPQDPRFQHLTTAPSVAKTTNPPRRSPAHAPSPEPSPPPSPEPSPPHSPSQCPSPDPSPPPSPSQCPSPVPSPPFSPSQCPSPEPSPPTSQCPSPLPGCPPSPTQSLCQSSQSNETIPLKKGGSGANEEHLVSREFTAGTSKDKQDKPQRKDRSEEPSIKPFIAPERTSVSLSSSMYRKDNENVKEAQKRAEEESTVCNNNKEEIIDISVKEEPQEVKEVFPSPPALRLGHIDSIVDKHLGNFSSEIQLLLQEENIHYNRPQSPHSHTETAAHHHVFPQTSISQFSQYVSFYNPCPPVQDYVSSLQDGISSILTEFEDGGNSRTETDASLANTVSAFVASIRAANTTTGRAEDVSAPSGDAGDAEVSSAQTPVPSRGDQDKTRPDQFPDITSSRNPPAPHVTGPAPTSASTSVYKSPDTTVLYPLPNTSPSSQWKPQQGHTTETNRTTDSSTKQPDSDGVICAAGSDSDVTLTGFSSVSKPSTETSQASEQLHSSSSASASVPAPPATALSSLISQLQPEVFTSLVEIIKDIKKNSLHFYLHSTEPDDQVHEDIKEHLLKQGNVEQSPVDFLNQENSDNRLLVIIKNKDIAGHVHKIPSLMSLKRHPSVAFVGIDTLDDIRNKSYNELFVSGGCIVSDELVLNPDFITIDRLSDLLLFLDQHSSLENVWRWKIHCKIHKKLKEQARFRRDAANILDLLSVYQRRQIVEFLPYHHCDMMNHQSPDLDCLIELQARYTQYRHTIFLTKHRFEKFHSYSRGGIIVATIEDILHNFTRIVGYHDIKDKQPIMDDLLAAKGLSQQLSHSDCFSGSERSPSSFPGRISPLSSSEQPPHHLQPPSSGLLPLPHLFDQLVPDASCKQGEPQPSQYEVLRLAISQLRAERQAQLQEQQQQQQLNSQAGFTSFTPSAAQSGSSRSAGHDKTNLISPGRKAVAATLEQIHSTLQTELGEVEKREVRAQPSTEGVRRSGGAGRSNGDSSSPLIRQHSTTVTGTSDHTDSTSVRQENAGQRGTANHSASSSSPAEGNRSRDAQKQPTRSDRSALGVTKVTGSEDNPCPAPPRLRPPPPPHLLQRLQTSSSFLPQQQATPWAGGVLQPPPLPPHPSQLYPPNPVLRPLTNLGHTSVYGLGHTGAAATLVWGFQPSGSGSSLLGMYHSPAGQGGGRYRGGQRGGFNGM